MAMPRLDNARIGRRHVELTDPLNSSSFERSIAIKPPRSSGMTVSGLAGALCIDLS